MMYADEQLNDIFDRTDGKCHICREKINWRNYTFIGEQGAWEVDHSNPKSNGGTDRKSNLYAACISCNRSKGSKSTRSQRAKYGYSSAPESRDTRVERWVTWFSVGIISLIGISLISKSHNTQQNQNELWRN